MQALETLKIHGVERVSCKCLKNRFRDSIIFCVKLVDVQRIGAEGLLPSEAGVLYLVLRGGGVGGGPGAVPEQWLNPKTNGGRGKADCWNPFPVRNIPSLSQTFFKEHIYRRKNEIFWRLSFHFVSKKRKAITNCKWFRCDSRPGKREVIVKRTTWFFLQTLKNRATFYIIKFISQRNYLVGIVANAQCKGT